MTQVKKESSGAQIPADWLHDNLDMLIHGVWMAETQYFLKSVLITDENVD
jgi:hypothetical protein